jgi:hypothetical protein
MITAGELEALFYPEYICDPVLEIARGDWWHIKLICNHGTFMAKVTSYQPIDTPLEIVKKAFEEYDHIRPCWKNEAAVPQSWKDDGYSYDTTECDLWLNHEGGCLVYEDDDYLEEWRKAVRFQYPVYKEQV